MILIRNKELNIPPEERYIGTTYDHNTEKRVFRLDRYSSSGTDLSTLDFLLGLKFASTRTIYNAVATVSEVEDENAEEADSGDLTENLGQSSTTSTTSGTTGDTTAVAVSVDIETFTAKVNKVTGTYAFSYNGSVWSLSGSTVDITEYGLTISGAVSGTTVSVVLSSTTSDEDIVTLTKTTETDHVLLAWEILNRHTNAPGVVVAQLRGYQGTYLRWSSFAGSFYVELCENTSDTVIGGAYVSALVALESRVKDVIERAEDETEEAEKWAVGQAGGTDVPSTDPTYHNNAKFYSQQSQSYSNISAQYSAYAEGYAEQAEEKADAAVASASAASTSASNAATSASNAATSASSASGSASAAATSASNASTSETNANTYSITAEKWAVGKANGQNVPSTDPTYRNNAWYYAGQASNSSDLASASENSAKGYMQTALTYSQSAEGYANTASSAATTASSASTAASSASTTAQTNGLKSEGFAVGQQNGVDVGSSSPYYHNNAKYYSEQAASGTAVKGVKVVGTELTKDSDGKVDIPYADTNGNPGVIRQVTSRFLSFYNGGPYVLERTFAQYEATDNHAFIGKGVLENVLAAYHSKKVPKTTLDSVMVVDTAYYLGSQTSVSLVLPSTASAGDEIRVVFYSGSTAATLSLSGSYLGTLPTPSTNQRIELSLLYDGTNWSLLSNSVSTS